MPSVIIEGPAMARPVVPIDAQSPFRSPSIRREPKLSANNLRTLFQTNRIPIDPFITADTDMAIESATPILPPTPPHLEDEPQDEEPSSPDTTKLRSVLVTPVNQLSPPTPDITPPRTQRSRPFLGARPSMASTYAESFRTAQEEITSDLESNLSNHSLPLARSGPIRQHSPILPPLLTNGHKPSPLSQALSPANDDEQIPHTVFPAKPGTRELKGLAISENNEQPIEDSPVIPPGAFPRLASTNINSSLKPIETQSPVTAVPDTRRGPSLRKRLEESSTLPHSASVEKFADIIGWSETVQFEDKKRWSGRSASTVEAIVIEAPKNPKRRGTLRHVSKHDSLRSVSSPLPPSHKPPSMTNSDSPHRLTHKRAKLSNRNRESFGSDHSRSISLGSNIPAPRVDIIKVAVIPERLSSLHGSSNSSRRHSRSLSAGSPPIRQRRQSIGTAVVNPHEPAFWENGDRSRGRYYPPQVGPFTVPPRASSLSAPTSRTTSRANSLTSDSIRSARRQAEKELRTTLNQMESERIASSLTNTPSPVPPAPPPKVAQSILSPNPPTVQDFAGGAHLHPPSAVPGTAEWAAMRPPSLLATPFSAPSFLSASPEISEARIISLFPHRNHSVQLIEPSLQPESNAVAAVRQQPPSRVRQNSPFREPRVAPSPPTSNMISAGDRQSNTHGQAQVTKPSEGSDEVQSTQRPGQARTNSFAKNFMRTVSLKHARNKKADQDLDSRSHPMWRPHAFWEDPDAKKDPEEDGHGRDRGLVQNSVGIPQQRSTFTGPIALMHRISNRRRNRKTIAKQSSYSSLHRLRAGKKLYRIPGLGVHLQMMGLRDIQERINRKHLRKQDEERERRREELRKSIGPNVISTGDSRFMTTTT